MFKSRKAYAAGASVLIALAADSLQGATPVAGYPTKPIRIVTAAVGSSNDLAARTVAQSIADPLGQPVIVDNRSSGSLIGELVSRAPADGHTLIIYSTTLWIGPLLQKTAYDPIRDFAPIAIISRAPNVLVVHPSLPIHSVKDLIATAKAKPGALNYSVGGTGGASFLAGALFQSMTGVSMVPVAYKSSAVENADLISGQVQLTFSSAVQISPHIKSGRMRAIAVTSLQPSALFPELPTVAASGLPGYDAGVVVGILAPAPTPTPVVARLNQEIVRALNRPDMKERFLNAGSEAVGSSPEEFAGFIKSEVAKWGKVIKDAGIRAD